MSLIFFILFLLSFTSSVLPTKDDEIILLKIKKQLGDPVILSSWVKGFNFCVSGTYLVPLVIVGCTSTGRVSILEIQRLDVSAPFPDAVCDLTELKYFSIDQMRGLYGPIPSCVTKLPNLIRFIIQHTSLSGPVPNFHNHTNLKIISLAYNHLHGTIPPSLSTLPNLNILELSSNYLTGTIPSGLVHGRYSLLLLSNNNLTGEIPKCYGWVDLYLIDVGNNRLSGDASFLFGKQKKVATIVLANNDFAFDLSYVEFSDNICWLNLSHNRIYGKVPDSFATAARLQFPDLAFNRLCGELPQGDNMWRFNAAIFANNTCLCGSPLLPCFNSAHAPVPISAPPF